ncbi:hypothetical protein GCM10023206_06640 [Acinetobacter puyangensis]|uniref:Bacteriophage holin family, superfamily II-like n=1 Tax=Acinetobacter puyangensis TaxID=1096779 RepID=A0A240E675_9GAMM|nr:holin [Acinetobacter puyangensis]SNX44257.1 Bacteriophage holin family, superfamily II-like [Acinetobacter puyangensis]
MSADHAQTAIEASAAVTSASSKTAVVGGSVTFLGWVTSLDPITIIGVSVGIGGLLVSVLSFLINWHYKKLENKRADEIHQLKVKELKGECDAK